jgi:hypothetical protein
MKRFHTCLYDFIDDLIYNDMFNRDTYLTERFDYDSFCDKYKYDGLMNTKQVHLKASWSSKHKKYIIGDRFKVQGCAKVYDYNEDNIKSFMDCCSGNYIVHYRYHHETSGHSIFVIIRNGEMILIDSNMDSNKSLRFLQLLDGKKISLLKYGSYQDYFNDQMCSAWAYSFAILTEYYEFNGVDIDPYPFPGPYFMYHIINFVTYYHIDGGNLFQRCPFESFCKRT